MNLVIGYQVHVLIRKIIDNELGKLNVKFKIHNYSQIEILEELPCTELETLTLRLAEYGIQIKESQRDQFIQKVKNTVTEIICNEDYYSLKLSNVISEKLNLSYGYISNAFSEQTLSTLENYIILQKIERAKTLLLCNEYTLSEIAFMLNYSSVGHLSSQFKKITGITSTQFIKIIKRRNCMTEERS
nr:helix-turn-helix domain-containing protein [Cytophagales bacterium]